MSWQSINKLLRYNTRDDKWAMAPPLLTNRSAPGASVLNGFVYTVGKRLLYYECCVMFLFI